MKKLRIFAASPSDVAAERAKVETVAAMLKPLADHLDLALDVVDWRAVVPDMGRPEQVILDQLKPTSWDVFVGILWHRFGTPPAGTDPQTQQEYLSGTEEEFKTAYRLWQQQGKPRVMMYRCTRAIPQEGFDPDQYKRVKEFFAQLEATKGEYSGLYQSFDTTESFERLLFDNLQKLLLAYGEKINGQPVAPEVVQSLAPKIPDNLPRRAPFFGRDKDMAVVMRAVSPEDRTWGVLLDGIGGIGKSALAVEAAYRCKERGLFEAFIFVSAKQNILEPERIRELKPAARTLDEFLNESARVLSRTDIARLVGNDKRRALLDALREMRVLLIYDHLETLSKDEQEALAYFLRDLPPGCKAIITSRRRGGEGAVWLRLEKLGWEAARAIIESEMARAEQLANKLRRVGDARWSELYDETKGSPLALVHTLGLMRVRAALTFDGALDLLRGSGDADLQQFIFQEARRELTTNDEAALRALSFFVPSATFEAWMEVADLARNALETTIDRLSALSLVDLLASEERYALHPLTRDFVRAELLTDAQSARDLEIGFAKYWIAFAKENEGKEDSLNVEMPNLDAAEGWLAQAALKNETVVDNDVARLLIEMGSTLSSFLLFDEKWDTNIKFNVDAYKAAVALKDWNGSLIFARNLIWTFKKVGRLEDVNIWRENVTKIEQRSRKSVGVFLSYAREDRENVRLLYKKLQEAGFTPWMDVEDLLPGQDWELEIEKAIKKSDFALVCLSNLSTNKQGYIQKEIKIALDVLDMMPEGGVYLIPARLDECRVPNRLNKQQWVDLFVDGGFEKLGEALRTEIEKKPKA
ncbi:MAG: TIR domain-containing protein [Pyrinomonadaceae bacterium]